MWTLESNASGLNPGSAMYLLDGFRKAFDLSQPHCFPLEVEQC